MNLKVSLSLLIVSFHVGRSQNVDNNGNHFGNEDNKDGTTADAGTTTTLSDVPPEAICLFNSKCGPFLRRHIPRLIDFNRIDLHIGWRVHPKKSVC